MQHFIGRGDLTTRGLPAVHRMAHPESQSGSHASVASGVVLMLSPARKMRIDPTWVASTTGQLSNRTPVSLGHRLPDTRRAPREPWSAPELVGAEHRNHSGTVFKTNLRLVCST